MPNTKNFSLRVRIIDGLLQQRKGVSIQECLRVINNRLAARKSRVILIALKPQILENVAGEFCGDIGKDAIIEEEPGDHQGYPGIQ